MPTSDAAVACEQLEYIDDQIDPDLTPELYYLEKSATAKEFHYRLAKIITWSEHLTADQRDQLAAMVRKPWTGRKNKKGRAPLEERHSAIYIKYVLGVGADNTEIKHSVSVRKIRDEYKMASDDAAAKALRLAKEFVEG
ncbi:hypothetical protein, partial [Rhodovarius sp.]|uniref:hypothetical protein n=1 Tax=Rhodovarius sp. TaxID=2972673 RepID=UPI0034A541C7